MKPGMINFSHITCPATAGRECKCKVPSVRLQAMAGGFDY
jgi:hypothetical protein